MYKNVIEIRKDVPEEMLKKLSYIADKAFDNRAGKVANVSNSPYCLIYEGGEEEYACLEVGMLILKREKEFLPFIEAWQWVDEENLQECCDILQIFAETAV